MELGNEKWITVAEAARQTGYSERTIQHLLNTGRIKGLKVRRDWLTTLQAVKDFKRKAKRGRPSKRN